MPCPFTGLCQHKIFWIGTKCNLIFGLAQNIWIGSKYFDKDKALDFGWAGWAGSATAVGRATTGTRDSIGRVSKDSNPRSWSGKFKFSSNSS